MCTVTPASGGMVPPLVAVAPAPMLATTLPWLASGTNEPVSSPVASVLLTPSILSEPGTYVVPVGTASTSWELTASSSPLFCTGIEYSSRSPGSVVPPFRSVTVLLATSFGEYSSVAKLTSPG